MRNPVLDKESEKRRKDFDNRVRRALKDIEDETKREYWETRIRHSKTLETKTRILEDIEFLYSGKKKEATA